MRSLGVGVRVIVSGIRASALPAVGCSINCFTDNNCNLCTRLLNVLPMNYIELHARSAFSFLRGASLPEELSARCAQLELPAMALLDRDGVYGAPRFHLAAQKLGVRAHIGAEVTLQDGSVLPLLVQNRAGYQNLCRLITNVK